MPNPQRPFSSQHRAGEVLQWAAIQRRSETQEGTQRKLSKAKVSAIKRFLLGDLRNTIPSALVLTLNVVDGAFTDVALPLPDGHPMKHGVKVVSVDVPENVPNNEKPGIVLDGQHRLLGMAAFSPMCMVNVVALLNVDDMEKAFQFLVINNKAAAVKSGRRVCGQEKSKDVLSPFAQQKHGFAVEYLPSSTVHPHEQIYSTVGGQHLMDAYEERLHDNTVTPPDEAAAFRIDWPAWLLTRTERDHEIIEQMGRNERTQNLARKFGISPSRISQLRRAFHDDWLTFTDDLRDAGTADMNS